MRNTGKDVSMITERTKLHRSDIANECIKMICVENAFV